jgi:hypothetical protein
VVDADLFSEESGIGDRESEIGKAQPQVSVATPTRRTTVAGKAEVRTPPIPDPQSPIPNPRKDLFGDPVPAAKPKAKRAEPEVAVGRPATAKTGRRWKFLSEFVVGPCNRVAHASALSVVEEPGDGANPLVVHGPVGTGKTHLLEGIFAGLKRQSEQRPVYATAEEFTTKFVAASQHGKMGAFRRQFRECSALLLDDLHFLATKKATQAEFLHTFDALVADGRQVVVTTDCHPRLADELMPELIDRLLGGAVWGLLPPDPDTRLEILRKKATGANYEDQCLDNLSCYWAAIQGSTEFYTCGTPSQPSQKIVPHVNVRGEYLSNEVWSPQMSLSGSSGSDFRLRYTVYRDLPLDNLIFHIWHVRTTDTGGCPGAWKDRNFVYYGDQKDCTVAENAICSKINVATGANASVVGQSLALGRRVRVQTYPWTGQVLINGISGMWDSPKCQFPESRLSRTWGSQGERRRPRVGLLPKRLREVRLLDYLA